MGKTSCVFFAVQLFLTTMCVYYFLYGIVSKPEVPIQYISMGIASLLSGFGYYISSNAAHMVYLDVRLL
jgi:hypothetical protein